MRIILKTTQTIAWTTPDPSTWPSHAAEAERAGDHLLALVWRARQRAWEAWHAVADRAARTLAGGGAGAKLAEALARASTGAAMAHDALTGRRFAGYGIRVEYDEDEAELVIEYAPRSLGLPIPPADPIPGPVPSERERRGWVVPSHAVCARCGLADPPSWAGGAP